MKSTYGLNAIFSQENSKKGADEKKSEKILGSGSLKIGPSDTDQKKTLSSRRWAGCVS